MSGLFHYSMKFTVYILYTTDSDKYYVGQTEDYDLRFQTHNDKNATGYTSKYQPWRLFWRFEVDTRSKAMILEKYLKKKPREFI